MIWRCGAILLVKRLAILTVPVSRGRRNVPIKLSPTQFYTTTFGFTFPFNSHVIPILFHHGLASHSQSILMFLSFSGWWFGTFFIFPYIGNHNPDWRTHIFQRGRYTTNQLMSNKKAGCWYSRPDWWEMLAIPYQAQIWISKRQDSFWSLYLIINSLRFWSFWSIPI